MMGWNDISLPLKIRKYWSLYQGWQDTACKHCHHLLTEDLQVSMNASPVILGSMIGGVPVSGTVPNGQIRKQGNITVL